MKKTKRIFIILMLIVLFMTFLVSTATSQTILEKNKQSNWVYIHGIGNFNITNEDILLSGIIFIGFRGTKLIHNEQIVITEENNIFLIATKHFLHAIIRV